MLGLGVKIPEVATRRKGVGGGGPPAGKRYWQFQVLSNNGYTESFVQRIELYDANLNVNRAFDATVTGDGSGGSFPPSALNNQAVPVPIVGNDYWKDTVTPVTLDAVFDFGVGNVADIKGFGILTPGLNANWSTAAPNSMKLRSSPDNATWTDEIVPAAQTGWPGYNGQHRQFYATGVATENVSYGEHRYWRVLFLANGGNGFHFVATSVDFRETRGGPNVATGGTATASSQYDGTYLPAYAFDGSFDTAWHSLNTDSGAWLKYDFGVGVTKNIREVFIMGRNEPSFAPGQTPQRGVLQFSDDNTKWHTAFPFRSTGDISFGGSFDTRVFSDPRFPAPGGEVQSLSATDHSTNVVIAGDSVYTTAGSTIDKARAAAPIYGKKVWLGRLSTTLNNNFNFGLATRGWRIETGSIFMGGDGGGQSASIVETGVPYLANNPGTDLTNFAASDIIMCAFDDATGKVWFGKNGTWFGDPAAGTGQATTVNVTHKQWYPAWLSNNPNMGISYCFDGLPKIARTNFLAIASGDIPAAPTGFSYFAAP